MFCELPQIKQLNLATMLKNIKEQWGLPHYFPSFSLLASFFSHKTMKQDIFNILPGINN